MNNNGNGNNTYGVSYSIIAWLEQALKTHSNILSVIRYDDIIFEVKRFSQRDKLTIFCADEYVCGITFVQHVLAEYPKCDIISVGGGWNGYTYEAKEFCLASNMGLFISDELMGGLHKDEYWNYAQKNGKGEPFYYYRTAS